MNFLTKIRLSFEKYHYFIFVLFTNTFIHAPLSAQSPRCYTPTVMEQYWQAHPELKVKFEQENRILKDSLIPFLANRANKTYGIIYIIPVVIHVMHNNGPENITDEQIFSQIDALNEDFGRYGQGHNNHLDGADSGIRFCLATKDPQGNLTDGINRVLYPQTDSFTLEMDLEMKNLNRWDTKCYMNIWIVKTIIPSLGGGDILAYAYYPSGSVGEPHDGMVVRYNYFGSKGVLADSNLNGRPATHEVGHYLNLFHTWGDGDCSVDDKVEDTPNCSGVYISTYPDCLPLVQCNNIRMIENYMDYSDDKCMNIFTKGQTFRMQAAIFKYRSTLISVENLISTGCNNYDSIPNITFQDEIYVFPNPATDQVIVYVDIEDVSDLKITLYNQIGQMISEWKYGQQTTSGPYILNINPLSAGIYFIKVMANSKTKIEKIFINN